MNDNKNNDQSKKGLPYGAHCRKSKNPLKNAYVKIASAVPHKEPAPSRGKHAATEVRRERLVLLIDLENIGMRNIDKVMCEAGQFGKLAVRYAYGVHVEALGNSNLTKQALEPRFVTQIRKGKNASDIAIAADAMELCCTRDDIDGFVIVSDDSDYASLVLALRNRGMSVYGVGTENAPQGYRDVCNGFRTFSKHGNAAKAKKTTSKPNVTQNAPEPVKTCTYSKKAVNRRVRDFVTAWLESDKRELTIADVANFINKSKGIPTVKEMGYSKVSKYVVAIGCSLGSEQRIISIK